VVNRLSYRRAIRAVFGVKRGIRNDARSREQMRGVYRPLMVAVHSQQSDTQAADSIRDVVRQHPESAEIALRFLETTVRESPG
jgi:hypothetical protein